MEAKELRETTLEAPRRGAEVKDDDPIIPFGPQPTVSRFGAISRTSKTGYQTTGPVQAMASTSQSQNSKHMPMTGKNAHKPLKVILKWVKAIWVRLLTYYIYIWVKRNPHNNGIIPSIPNLKVRFCHLCDCIANCCTAGGPDWAHVRRMVLTTVIWNFFNFILILVG